MNRMRIFKTRVVAGALTVLCVLPLPDAVAGSFGSAAGAGSGKTISASSSGSGSGSWGKVIMNQDNKKSGGNVRAVVVSPQEAEKIIKSGNTEVVYPSQAETRKILEDPKVRDALQESVSTVHASDITEDYKRVLGSATNLVTKNLGIGEVLPTMDQDVIEYPSTEIMGTGNELAQWEHQSGNELQVSASTSELNKIGTQGLNSANVKIPDKLTGIVNLMDYFPSGDGEQYNIYNSSGNKINQEPVSGDFYPIEITMPGSGITGNQIERNGKSDVVSVSADQHYSFRETYQVKAVNDLGFESETSTPVLVKYDQTMKFTYMNSDPRVAKSDGTIDPASSQVQEFASHLDMASDESSARLVFKDNYAGHGRGSTWKITTNFASHGSESVDQILASGEGNDKDWARLSSSMLESKGISSQIRTGSVHNPDNPTGRYSERSWTEFY
ncbi:MAG: transglutaminase-like domain-containing protein, partial [Candidatus Omnitrophica bacterium]|nr:transglutaminase-like domain-containing protein [Candidatus Omnitrophota bacterium]